MNGESQKKYVIIGWAVRDFLCRLFCRVGWEEWSLSRVVGPFGRNQSKKERTTVNKQSIGERMAWNNQSRLVFTSEAARVARASRIDGVALGSVL